MEKLQNALLQSPLMRNPMCSYALAQAGSYGLDRRDGPWFVVLAAVLLALGATIFIGMTIWCVVNGHGSFTGGWSWHDLFSLNVQCSW